MKTDPPFRAEHIGSLLRPAKLKAAYREINEGELTAEEFQRVQDECIREVVRLQEELGLLGVTDGEHRRASYWAHFVVRVDGMTVKPAVFRFTDQTGDSQEFLAPHINNKLRRTRSISGEEFSFLQSVTTKTPKLTMPSPPTMHFWRGRHGIEASAYPDLDEYFADLVQLYRDEISDLARLGARYIQMDEVPLAMLNDPAVRKAVKDDGVDPNALIGKYIGLINDATASRPQGMTIGMHLCRGNFKGRWLAAGGYDAVAERLFNEVEVDTFFLEYDSPRAGDFQPLQYVPENKGVVLGLVSTKTPRLESVDELMRRIDEASQMIPLERLAISPQCGFASTVAGNPLTEMDQINKLKLVVEVAGKVWG